MNWIKPQNTELSDEELIVMIKKAKSQEFAASLFSRYVEMIYGIGLKYFKDSEKSKDMTMDLYPKFVSKIKNHEIKHFKSWLYVLVKNQCLEKLRKEKREGEKFLDFKNVQSEDVFHPIQEDMKEKAFNDLDDCIQNLEKSQKQCVKLFYLEKKSYVEITKMLDLDWNKVRSLIQNGRRNLKNCLANK